MVHPGREFHNARSLPRTTITKKDEAHNTRIKQRSAKEWETQKAVPSPISSSRPFFWRHQLRHSKNNGIVPTGFLLYSVWVLPYMWLFLARAAFSHDFQKRACPHMGYQWRRWFYTCRMLPKWPSFGSPKQWEEPCPPKIAFVPLTLYHILSQRSEWYQEWCSGDSAERLRHPRAILLAQDRVRQP